MKKLLYIKTRFIGFHNWPNAPKPVEYLRALHRHEFRVTVVVEVAGSDREVEFHLLRIDVDAAAKKLVKELGFTPSMSCEQMAEYLHQKLRHKYPLIKSLSVSEEEECGAILSFI